MMNAKILTLALAATAMATGCMQKEVVSVPENGSQIGFSTWVGKPTKAVNDLNDNTKFKTFYVFGSYEKEGAYTTVFNNDAVTTSDNGTSWTAPVQYWVPDMEYKFIAYSDGNNKLTDVEFDDASGNPCNRDNAFEFAAVRIQIGGYIKCHNGIRGFHISGSLGYCIPDVVDSLCIRVLNGLSKRLPGFFCSNEILYVRHIFYSMLWFLISAPEP